MMLDNAKYILFTTYRRNGTPVSSPVWIVPLGDGRFGFTTSSASGKYKRLRNNSHVLVQPSDARGRTAAGTQPLEAEAVLVTGAEYESLKASVRAKYGLVTYLTRFLGLLGSVLKRKRIPYGDAGVVFSLTRS